ncbi:MAG TPA: nitroreductase family deazaflavin-dependent oxidoreductase [Terriglobales bacterium]|nr:nitroreductase family deazaflavin-dependent oxidoreductase [Terriglobales bacterium]
MPGAKQSLREHLGRYREIKLTVIGRKSGKEISRPVWFVLEGNNLYLLPVSGSETQWYKNVVKNPHIRVTARDEEAEFRAEPLTDQSEIASIVDKFREKYGKADVKKYYSKFDVAAVLHIG